MIRRPLAVLSVLAVVLSWFAVTASEAHATTTSTYAKVIRWKDGDSLLTSAGEVRMIGINTPELGRCGGYAAKRLAQRLAPAGARIKLLNPSSVMNKDRYGRLLRYVDRGTVDLGRRQIKAGGKARYDGRDGYQWHPRQRTYRATDAAYSDYRCSTTSTGGAYAPISTNSCPSSAPIKGNQGSNGWIYHQPGQQYYAVTNPEQCFKTAADAEAAGYRAALV
jgi:micrococcal nuclease